MIYISGGNLMSETIMAVGFLAAMFGVLAWCLAKAERVGESAYPETDYVKRHYAKATSQERLKYHDIWDWDEQRVRQAVNEGRIDLGTATRRLEDIPGTDEQAEAAIRFGWNQGGR